MKKSPKAFFVEVNTYLVSWQKVAQEFAPPTSAIFKKTAQEKTVAQYVVENEPNLVTLRSSDLDGH
jgi:hypothetical protein